MKPIITTIIGIGFILCVGLYLEAITDETLVTDDLNVVEKMMDLQREIGCSAIDGEIGPETIRNYNEAKKAIRAEEFNKYAVDYFK